MSRMFESKLGAVAMLAACSWGVVATVIGVVYLQLS
jgi:hypothetical protein